jgi:hypothetical protein
MATAQPFEREITSAKDDRPHAPRLYAVLLLSLIAAALAPSTRAQVTDFASLDVPGATLTRPFDVNNFGVIVGRFDDQNGTHGFVYQGGSFTAIDFPAAGLTVAIGINDSGDVVGRFTTAGVDHGFLLSHGIFTQIDFPGSIATQCHGINSNGDIVGRYMSVEKSGNGKGLAHEHGFLLSSDRFSSVDFPNSVTTDAWKITDTGDIVGDWSSNGNFFVHGYTLHNGQFTSFDFPDARLTASREINANGQMVGIYQSKLLNGGTSAPGREHGFVVINGSYSGFDFPGSGLTDGNAINDSGLIVGSYKDSSGAEHGYMALISWK